MTAGKEELPRALQYEKLQDLKRYLNKMSPNSADSSYSLWKARKNLKRPIQRESPIRLSDGTWTRSDKENFKQDDEPLPNDQPICQLIPRKVIRFKLTKMARFMRDELNAKKTPGNGLVTAEILPKLSNVARIQNYALGILSC